MCLCKPKSRLADVIFLGVLGYTIGYYTKKGHP